MDVVKDADVVARCSLKHNLREGWQDFPGPGIPREFHLTKFQGYRLCLQDCVIEEIQPQI